MILLDCDDVLSQTCEALLDWYNFKYGTSFTREMMFDHKFQVSLGIPEERAIEGFEAIVSGDAPLLPYPGAREFVSALSKLGEVVACTATASARWSGARAVWLEEIVGIPAKSQIICGRSHKKFIQADLLIDDHWKNCEEFSVRQQRPSILVDRPWNKNYRSVRGPLSRSKVVRATSYEEILALVEDYYDIKF